MSKWILSLGLALLITACATPQPSPQTAAATTQGVQPQVVVSTGTQVTGQKLICSDSYPMGSHIPQRICLTQDQEAARKKAAQEAMRNFQTGGPKACVGTGC